MDKNEAIELAKRYKALLAGHFDIDQVYLFGSFARGNPRPDSDIDIAVVVNTAADSFFAYAPLLWKLRRQIDDRIEPVLIDKNNDRSGFLQDITRNGLLIN